MATHVLVKGSQPETLFSGHTSSKINGVHTPVQADSNNVVCGAEVGNRRSAISYTDFVKYENSGKLQVNRLCQACAKKLKVRRDNHDG